MRILFLLIACQTTSFLKSAGMMKQRVKTLMLWLMRKFVKNFSCLRISVISKSEKCAGLVSKQGSADIPSVLNTIMLAPRIGTLIFLSRVNKLSMVV